MDNEVTWSARLRVLVLLGLGGAAFCWLGAALDRKVSPATGDLRFSAVFLSVSGLKAGAPVRLAGVDVGRVLDLEFQRRAGRDVVCVSLAVRRPYAPLVRRGASISIESLGILGDKHLEIGLAQPGAPPLTSGETVPGAEPVALAGTLQKLDGAVEDFRVVTAFMRKVVVKTEGLGQIWENFKAKFKEE